MMIDLLTNADATGALERLMQFAGQRHRIITNNIANLSTPGFRPADVSVAGFQEQLGRAIDNRRSNPEPSSTSLELASSDEVEITPSGMVLHPQPAGGSILFHDGAERNIESSMQDLVENFMTFRTAADLLRSRFDLMNTAIRERI
jgi:flagellar basal-body rod protein FlgB